MLDAFASLKCSKNTIVSGDVQDGSHTSANG